MRKWFIALFVLLILAAGAGIGAFFYVSPEEELNLRYDEVPLKSRAIEMAKRLSPELVLTEKDVNNLAKAQLADNPNYMKNIKITGVRFKLADGQLIADVNLKAMERIPVGMQLTYEVKWMSPNLVATVTRAKLKDIDLPADSFNDVVIPLGSELPDLLKVQGIRIEDGQMIIEFKKPSLSDLRRILQ
ncbi:hypothetical protein [Cohnella sp. AR92]|uniref:hypothetical protein n=1 Tax=Cohnella sp. AR92 TaxID=648716 RepID=UPI000F8DFBF0|nr:hypothetical protein [Cohnella sp. AR92]RUS46725.1 hypothetical protein ELR57_13575 [Cohnella sp. AR92]